MIVVLIMKINKTPQLKRDYLSIVCFSFTLFITCFQLNVFSQYKSEIILENSIINYSNLKNWAAHPNKLDMSDSNNVIHKTNTSTIKAHVFFIHPTTYTNKLVNDQWNASVFDEELNEKTENSSILYQSTAFRNNTIIFAPRYRQAHINAFYIAKEKSDSFFEMAYQDIKNAFEYYLKNENNGFPIIIASHSQGTKHAGRLLKEFFENKDLKKKLICAYIIGMPIPSTYFSDLKPCEDENQTGCYVGWRTYKRGFIPEDIKKENFKCIVVNPLSWKMETGVVEKKMNPGGVLSNYKKLVPMVVDAEIHDNVLWSCKPDVPGKIFFTKKNFHIGDINLFYASIYKNVGNRIFQFLKNEN